jgi:hypothetical protein
MKTFESQLVDIARKQGVSVDKIVSLTRENEEILAKQKVGPSNFNFLNSIHLKSIGLMSNLHLLLLYFT